MKYGVFFALILFYSCSEQSEENIAPPKVKLEEFNFNSVKKSISDESNKGETNDDPYNFLNRFSGVYTPGGSVFIDDMGCNEVVFLKSDGSCTSTTNCNNIKNITYGTWKVLDRYSNGGQDISPRERPLYQLTIIWKTQKGEMKRIYVSDPYRRDDDYYQHYWVGNTIELRPEYENNKRKLLP